MNWAAISTITAIVCAVAAAFSSYQASGLKLVAEELRTDMQKLRTDFTEARAKDRDELREWINGSFMRAKLVEAEFNALAIRIDHLEHRKAA